MMLDHDQSKSGFSVVYIVFFFVALVLVGGFLDQSHAGTGTFKAESLEQAASNTLEFDRANLEMAESAQAVEETAQQTYID